MSYLNKRINEENHVKFCGVLVDSTLSWKPHIIELKKAIKNDCNFLYYILTKISVTLYNALIYRLLLYGITSWAPTYSSSLDALLALQNKFVKIIHFSDQYDSPHPLFISSNMLQINELHKLQLASFVYKSSLQQNPPEFIIILAIFQKFTPVQQGNPLIKNYSSHVKIQLSMAYSQSVMLERTLEQYSQGYQK